MTSATVPHAGSSARRVLLTGAAGFIGFHLARRLAERGIELLGIDNLNAYYDPALKRGRLDQLECLPGFRFEAMDIGDAAGLQRLFAAFRPHCVINLAAQAGVRYSLNQPHAYVSANVDGFLSVLEACRAHPVDHLIYASSSSVYGTNPKVPFHEDDPVNRPASLYAATKRANELMARTYAHLFGIAATGLRFFTIYGPWGRPDMAYYAFTKAILGKQPIDVYNHGRMRRDFTYVDDAVEAIARLVDQPPRPGDAGDEVAHAIYNVGNHAPVTLDRFITAIEQAVGMPAERRLVCMQPGDVPDTYADIERLSRATGFSPQTTIEDGISRFVAWYRQFHAV